MAKKDASPEDLALLGESLAAWGFHGDPDLVPIMFRVDDWDCSLMVMSSERPAVLMLLVEDRKMGAGPMGTTLDAEGVDRLIDVLTSWKTLRGPSPLAKGPDDDGNK